MLDLCGDTQGLLYKCKPSGEFTKGGQRPTPIPSDIGLGYQRLDLSSQVQRFHDVAGTVLRLFADAIRCFYPAWAGVCCACGQTGDETLVITQRSKQCYCALVLFYCIHHISINAVGHSQEVDCFCHALGIMRSEEHTSELQSPDHLVCRLLLEKKKHKRSIRLRPTADVENELFALSI